MFLTCGLLLASLAAAVIALVGLVALKRAHSFAAAQELERGQAALRTARRAMVVGLTTLAIALPAILLTFETSVPLAHRIVLAIIPLSAIIAFAALVATVDLRLQDKLRRMPPAAAAAPGPDESVTFELTADHLWRSQVQWHTHSPMGRIALGILLVGVLALVAGMPLLWRSMNPGRSSLVPSLLALGLALMVPIVFGKRLYVAIAGRHPGVLCEHRIEVRADGLREVTHANDTLWQWSDVREVSETPDYVMLRVRSIGLFSIPRSAFASDDQLRRFIDAVRLRKGVA